MIFKSFFIMLFNSFLKTGFNLKNYESLSVITIKADHFIYNSGLLIFLEKENSHLSCLTIKIKT
jgi:hypothetical protein